MDERVAKLAGLAGEGQERAPKYVLPLLKFNGMDGGFSVYDTEFKESTPVTQPVQITVLMRRKALSAWSSNDNHFSNEYKSPTQKIHLYKRLDSTVTLEATATAAELREKYPTLRTKEVIYCLFNGVVHKFDIKGASLKEFWDFTNKMRENGKEHTFQYLIGIKSEKVVEKGKVPYYKMVFSDEGESNLDAVEENMKVVSENLAKVDEFFARKIAEEFRAEMAAKPPVTVAPKVEVDEEINIDDIPF